MTMLLAACGSPAHRAPAAKGTAAVDTTSSFPSTTAALGITGASPPSSKPAAGPGPARGASTTTTRSGSGPAAALAPQPAAAGTYRYRQQGRSTAGGATTTTPPYGTLVVDRPGGDGTQLWHRASDPSAPPNDSTFRFATDGVALIRQVIRITNAGTTTTFTCTFDPGVPAPPWPPTVGAVFTGHGECGSFTADVSGRIDDRKQVTLDGAPVDVFVISSKLVTHGQVESTATQVDWYAPSLRLPVHSESSASGTYGFVSFQSTGTSDLESGHPSS
jgi:hypothetical protein